MYLSLGKAAKEAGVAKSTISKALSSGKLSYREKNSDGYQIDPAELFRVYPKTTKTDADEPAANDWQSAQADAETMPYSAKFEIQLAGLKSSDRGKRPPHHRSRSRPRAASRGPPPAHRELAGGARPAPETARGPDRHRQASDRRAEHTGGGSSTHVLAAGFPPQAGDSGLRISVARHAGMVAVLGGSYQIFESLTHEGYSDCSRSSRSRSRYLHRRRPLPGIRPRYQKLELSSSRALSRCQTAFFAQTHGCALLGWLKCARPGR